MVSFESSSSGDLSRKRVTTPSPPSSESLSNRNSELFIDSYDESNRRRQYSLKSDSSELIVFVEVPKTSGLISRKWILEKGQSYTIGRFENKVDILLSHETMSRFHARISIPSSGDPDQFIVKDLNSANGTFIQNNRLAPSYDKTMSMLKMTSRIKDLTSIDIDDSINENIRFAENPYVYFVIQLNIKRTQSPLRETSVQIKEDDHKPISYEHDEKPTSKEHDKKPISYEHDEKPISHEHDEKRTSKEYDKKRISKEHDQKPMSSSKKKKDSSKFSDKKRSGSSTRHPSDSVHLRDRRKDSNRGAQEYFKHKRNNFDKRYCDEDFELARDSHKSKSKRSNFDVQNVDTSVKISSSNFSSSGGNFDLVDTTRPEFRTAQAVARAAALNVKARLQFAQAEDICKQKKKMLWSSSNNADSTSSREAPVSVPISTNTCNGGDSGADICDAIVAAEDASVDGNPSSLDTTAQQSYGKCFTTNDARHVKFMKLLGHGGFPDNSSFSSSLACNHTDKDIADDSRPGSDPCVQNANLPSQLVVEGGPFRGRCDKDLESQYMKGLRRKDGRKVGLGL